MVVPKELTPEENAALSYVHLPEESRNNLVDLAQRIYGTSGITTGSKYLDDMIISTRPSWMRAWVGPSGGGKSTILKSLELREARRIEEEAERTGEGSDKYVAKISYEESAEIIEIAYANKRGFLTEDFWRGKVHPDEIKKATAGRGEKRIITFAVSARKLSPNSPRMTIDTCLHAMRALWKTYGWTPSLITIDYAQEIIIDKPSGNRTADVIQGMKDVDHLAKIADAAIEIAVQSKQEVEKRIKDSGKVKENVLPLPGLGDIEWTNFIKQIATYMVGVCKPWNTHSFQQWLCPFGENIRNHKDLMIARWIKRRFGGGERYYCPFTLDYETLTIKDMVRNQHGDWDITSNRERARQEGGMEF